MDTGGLIYPKAINQLFVGLYVMECYLIGLFFLVRNEDDQVACIGQGVIMTIVTLLTASYQILLNQAFGPLFRYLPVVLPRAKQADNETRNESQLLSYSFLKKICKEIKNAVDEDMDCEDVIERSCGMKNPHAKETDEKIEKNVSMIMQCKDLTAEPPLIWLPRDILGLSKDAIKQTKDVSASILISDENAELGRKGAVFASGGPPTIRHSL